MTDTTAADRWEPTVRRMLMCDGRSLDVFKNAAEMIAREMLQQGHELEDAAREIEYVGERYFGLLASISPVAERVQ